MKTIAFLHPIGKKEALEKAQVVHPANTQQLVGAQDADEAYFRLLESKGIYLDQEQLIATRSINGPTMLIAGAGSGKTRVLISRVGYMLHHTNIKPSEMMLVTFTTKAADEMKERLQQLFSEEVVNQITVGTFHSIFLSLLRSEGYKQKILGSDRYKQIILKKISKELKCDMILAAEVISSKISGWKNQMVSYDEVVPKNMMERHMSNCYERYEQWLYEENMMDFDDIINNAVNLLENNEALRNYMKSRFRAISIDEMQDSNKVQNRLIELVTEPNSNVFFVGDPQQAIYGFRYSSSKYLLELATLYPNLTTLYLSTNYRSNDVIVGAANSILMEVLNESKVIRSVQEAVYFTRPKDVHEEARLVADEIERSTNFKDCAVLYRINTYSRAILEELVYRKIPVKLPKKDIFYEQVTVKQVLAHLRILITPSDTTVLTELAPTLYISKDAAYDVTIKHIDESITGLDILLPLCKDYQIEQLKKRKQLLKQIEFLEPKSAIQKIRTIFYNRFVKSIADNSIYQDMVNNVLDELETSAQRFKTIPDYIEFIDTLINDVQQLEAEEDAVTLSTIHQSKGLEWPIVYLIGVVEKVLPHHSALTTSAKPDQVLVGREALLEENRLLYVAMTRAGNELYVSSPKVYHAKLAKLSSFLSDKK